MPSPPEDAPPNRICGNSHDQEHQWYVRKESLFHSPYLVTHSHTRHEMYQSFLEQHAIPVYGGTTCMSPVLLHMYLADESIDSQRSLSPCSFITRWTKDFPYMYLIAGNFSNPKMGHCASTNQRCHEYPLGTALSMKCDLQLNLIQLKAIKKPYRQWVILLLYCMTNSTR